MEACMEGIKNYIGHKSDKLSNDAIELLVMLTVIALIYLIWNGAATAFGYFDNVEKIEAKVLDVQKVQLGEGAKEWYYTMHVTDINGRQWAPTQAIRVSQCGEVNQNAMQTISLHTAGSYIQHTYQYISGIEKFCSARQ